MKSENNVKKSTMKWKVQTGLDSTKQVRTSYKVNREKIMRRFKNFCQQSMWEPTIKLTQEGIFQKLQGFCHLGYNNWRDFTELMYYTGVFTQILIYLKLLPGTQLSLDYRCALPLLQRYPDEVYQQYLLGSTENTCNIDQHGTAVTKWNIVSVKCWKSIYGLVAMSILYMWVTNKLRINISINPGP